MMRALKPIPVLLLAVALPAMAEQPMDFDRDVRPILEQHCFKCHGPEKQKGGLRLDVKPAALKGGDSGEPAIVPGNSLKSHLIQLVSSNDPEQAMPPKGERLKPEEIARLQKWIETGAHWQDKTAVAASQPIIAVAADAKISTADRQFWSFAPPRQVDPAPVKNSGWPRTRVDQFILAKLEERGLEPSSEAPRGVLIRRLTFDLTGLPPTPEEVEAFTSDSRPDAYERVVERLLGSPRFGERLASMWLPLARYAEDQAHQVGSDTKFFYPNAWKYREWVVNAFNRDVPYDRFVRFQIAADQFKEASPEDQAALGFVGLGPKYYNRNRLEVMADEWEDRVDTVSRTMLGLTVACARCHDHKFDPISQRDYYALAGVFASTKMINKTPDGKVQKGDLKAEQLDPATVHVVEEGETQDLNLFIRGDVNRKGPIVPRHFLSILSPASPAPFKEGSGRKELALAIADRNNPLTARVMVNRVWGLLTGQPIVATPSNFGHSGQPPINPQLLDDLAVRFMENGWSVKWLVREIVNSATYRQSAAMNSRDSGIDPANELLWRMNRRRMTVEQWRDSLLLVSGQLQSGGGKSVEVDDPKNLKRTLYARISRLKLNDLLMQFDYPDANVHAERRSVTNTPIQKLFVLNSPFMIERAKAFSTRLARESSGGDESRIGRAYWVLYGRGPTAEEMRLGVEFLQEAAAPGMTRWEEYAQVLLACNEALYVD
jgi:mono/diheme cytochrome c family protein